MPAPRAFEEPYICHVPDELLIRIFWYLDVIDQRTFPRVSSGFSCLLRIGPVQRRLIIRLARFNGWNESWAVPFWTGDHEPRAMSLQFVCTLLSTLTPDVKHLFLLADEVHKLCGPRLRVYVSQLLEVLYGCVKYSGSELKSITVANARSTYFDLAAPWVCESQDDSMGLHRICDSMRWEKVSFRIKFRRFQWSVPVVSVRSALMDTTLCGNAALLDMLNAACGFDPSDMQTAAKEELVQSTRLTEYKLWDATVVVLNGRVLAYSNKAEAETKGVVPRPLHLMCLLWEARNSSPFA